MSLCTLGVMLASSSLPWAACPQADYDRAPILYRETQAADPVALLGQRVAAGAVTLGYEESRGYLASFLAELRIPISSQTLVFSKTSFQAAKITPRLPRALYFGDDVYVGWVQGSELLEVASMDPDLGAVFYTITRDSAGAPRFQRQTDACLQCHDSRGLTLGVPGLTVRSVFPSGDGTPHYSRGTFHTTYRSPLAERWGGWYVTGSHGRMRHLGNATFPDQPDPEAFGRLLERGANVTSLSSRLDLEPYLAPTSDIVALMLLEHQTTLHNLLTRANHETRMALYRNREMNRALGEPENALRDSARTSIKYACEPLLEGLFFSGEAILENEIRGNSKFREGFEKRGPFDRSGRTLRELDLCQRMFKYPLSYLVYSKSLTGLPREAKDYLFLRMSEILKGQDTSKEFAHLSGADRKAILEILRDTLPEFADAAR